MALTVYNTLVDDNSNLYNIIPPPDYQDIWYNSSQADGRYYTPTGSWQDDAGNSTTPFTQQSNSGQMGFEGRINFTYNGNTIGIQFYASSYNIAIYYNNQELMTIYPKGANFNEGITSVWFVKNEQNRVAIQGKYVGYSSGSAYKIYAGGVFNEQWSVIFDEILTHSAQPTYNWQSVPSISGKNGILLLSTIQSVYLNNGDPVNNALESYIDFIDDSKVAVLVGEQIDDLTKVTVKYIVPAGTYEYIKLVYKVGSAPTSITDGTAVDILQADKSVEISGIADGNTYWFKIFTDITESEPYEFTTIRPEGEKFFAIDLNTDGHDIMRHDPNKIINVEYSYYGELRPWFNAAQGALTDAEHPSQPTYTISNGELTTTGGTQILAWAYDVTANQRIIPANCTLWFEFDAYFLNSEGYLDWRIYDNQGAEAIYWCWDTKYNFGSGIWYNCQLKASVVNGIINRIEYYIDHTMVDAETEDVHMLCIDETNPVPLYYITFTTTMATKLKNMKIYWE